MTINKGFKRKTIEKIIKYKIDNWLKSITNENLRLKIKNNYIVTGGAIVSLLQGEQPNDLDIYFSDFEIAKEVVEYYLQPYLDKEKAENSKVSVIKIEENDDGLKIFIKSLGIINKDNPNDDYEYFEQLSNPDVLISKYLEKNIKKNNYSPIMITSNAISLSNDIQIITRFIGEPSKIHENFDFLHCTNYFTEKTGLVTNINALETIISRELKYIGSKYPIASLFRIRKFIKRDWTINAGEILKIAWDVSKLNLNDVNILQDQLTGVDVSYFNQIIQILKENFKNGETIDRLYLIELIERIFDDASDDFINDSNIS